MKNQWLLLLKNDDLSNLLRDLPFVLAREFAVVVHNTLFAPRSLAAVADVSSSSPVRSALDPPGPLRA